MANGTTEGAKKPGMNIPTLVLFAVLIVGGIFLAVYAAKYVPATLSKLSSAVILSGGEPNNTQPTTQAPQAQNPTPTPVPPAATTTQTTKTPTYTPTTGVTTRVIQTGPTLYGLPDLALMNVRGGYLSGTQFIESSRVPNGDDMVVLFTVRNIGTNIASGWRVRVRVEGQEDAIAYGGNLYPGGSQAFALRVTDSETGTITTDIQVDYLNALYESSESNNFDSIDLTVRN